MSDKTECYLLLTSISLVKDCDPYPKEIVCPRSRVHHFVNYRSITAGMSLYSKAIGYQQEVLSFTSWTDVVLISSRNHIDRTLMLCLTTKYNTTWPDGRSNESSHVVERPFTQLTDKALWYRSYKSAECLISLIAHLNQEARSTTKVTVRPFYNAEGTKTDEH